MFAWTLAFTCAFATHYTSQMKDDASHCRRYELRFALRNTTQHVAKHHTTQHTLHTLHTSRFARQAYSMSCHMYTRSTAQHAQSDILFFYGRFKRNAVELVLLIQQFVVHFETPAQTEVRTTEQIAESSVSQVAAGPLFGLLSRVRILSHVTRQAHISKRVAAPFSVFLPPQQKRRLFATSNRNFVA